MGHDYSGYLIDILAQDNDITRVFFLFDYAIEFFFLNEDVCQTDFYLALTLSTDK